MSVSLGVMSGWPCTLHRVWSLVTEQVAVTSQFLRPNTLRHIVVKDAVVWVDLVSPEGSAAAPL